MQQILAKTADTQSGFLSFNFNSTKQESSEFSNILQKNVDNSKGLDKIEKLNDAFASKLDEIDEDSKLKKESGEISDEAFGVLSLISQIVDDFNKISTADELSLKMQQAGISDKNIQKAFKMLENASDFKGGLNNQAFNDSNIKPNNQNIIEQFKNNDQGIKHLLSEKILTGKEINSTKQNVINPITTEKSLSETTETNNAINKDNKISEMLKLFKQENKAANQELNAQQTDLDKKGGNINTKQDPQNSLNATQTTKNAEVMAELNPIDNKIKTHGELNKSEYKELANKFNAKISDEANQSVDGRAYTSKPVEETTFNPINNIVKPVEAQEKQTTKVNTINNLDSIDSTKTEQTNNDIKTGEAKPLASNFNMNLYKLAQQTNIQNQITLAIRNLKDTNSQQIKIKLNPAELGSVSIEMEMSKNATRGIITVEKPELAKHLAQNLNKMFTGFKESGFDLNTDNIVVKIGTQNQQQDSNFKQQTNKQKTSSQEYEQIINLNEDKIDIKV